VSASGRGVLIVTPTYDERENLEEFVEGVSTVCPEAEVLVVDDASPDGTGELADALAARDPRVHVLHRPRKMGLGSAYLDAFRWGLARKYTTFVQMDTDGSHDPGYLPQLLGELEHGADLVIGSRNVPGGNVEGWGLGRHLLSKGGSLYSRILLGIEVRDLTSGFKAFKRETLEAIDLGGVRSEGYAFQIELTYRAMLAGKRVAEHPIVFVDRRVGQSKMSRRIVAEAVIMVPALRVRALSKRL
jgi:dolichol-phosphate mannosyltransferase